jgi:hypothetical protein
VYPATGFSHWITAPDGTQQKLTYAERFKRQFQQFKSESTQTKAGTPLSYALFLTEARRAELRALNIYTVEALAHIDGLELKNLGMHGRDLKNKAMEFIEEAKKGAPNLQLLSELEALKARNSLLEEDVQSLKIAQAKPQPTPAVADRSDTEFDSMDLNQLREYIATNTGQHALGSLNRKTLIRMAQNARPSKVA